MDFFEVTAFAEPAENAQTTASTQAEGTPNMDPNAQVNGTMAMITSLLPMVLIFVLLYFMMIRPQRKKEKEKRAMINALKVGDKVVTIGGIVGKVHSIKDRHVVLETGNVGTPAERSYIKMERDSINTVEKKLSN